MATRLFYSSDNLPSAPLRIQPIDISRFNVASYDIDNGYPQRMETLVDASPTAKMATQLFADFIFGQGFSVSDGKTKSGKDKEDGVWNMVLNSDGQTGDDLLAIASEYYSNWEKFYVHINYNALFKGVELRIVPYEFCRYGVEENEGKIAVYSKWWTRNRFGSLNTAKDKPDYIDIFNPDPAVIKKQISNAGGWSSYKGQIAAFGRTYKRYPLHVLDAAIEDVEAEILAKKTAKNNIKNNFSDKVLWIEKGEKQSLSEEEEFLERARSFVGTDGPQLMVANVDNIDSAPEFKTIENKLDDKKFKYTIENARATIYRLVKQNAILHSDLTEGRYNQNQLPEAIKAYNNGTERSRIFMQRSFSSILAVMGIIDDCNITPINENSFAINNTQGAGDGSNPINIQE